MAVLGVVEPTHGQGASPTTPKGQKKKKKKKRKKEKEKERVLVFWGWILGP
jgi:hypothetical protein